MKLTPIAHQTLVRFHAKMILESTTGTASTVQKKMFALGNELKKDGEDVTDQEVQAAMLSALIDADGKVDAVDVSDIEAVSKEIKESRNYIAEDAGILHTIETMGTILGNTAFLHILTEGLHKMGFKDVDENKLKARLEKAVSTIKKVTGYPAKIMEKAFTWIAKKLGASQMGQKIAGISGVLVTTLALLALAVYLFPSISSGVLMIFAISGMIGKGAEIVKLVKELVQHVGEHAKEKGIKAAPTA